MKLAITVDNIADELYVDGVLTPLPNKNHWENVDIVTIPADTSVIAVKGIDKGVSYSLIWYRNKYVYSPILRSYQNR